MAVTGVNLEDQPWNGLINESVMQKIWDISRIPLPLTDKIGTDSHGNNFCEWTVDELQAPGTNAQVDGSDQAGDDTNLGNRKGNYSQIGTKVVKVSTRARESDTIGFSDALSYQVMQRQRELRRDVEYDMLANNPSRKDNGTLAGLSASLPCWVVQGVDNGSTAGGWNDATGIVDARTPAGDAADVALTETMVRAGIKAAYLEGGEVTCMMSTPSMIQGFSNYLFESSARVAALQSEVNQQRSAVTATGAVNVFVDDFGTVQLDSNRLMPTETPGVDVTSVNVMLIDPTMLRLSYLSGYRTEPLAKTGLADTRQVCVDWSLKVLNESAQSGVFGVNQDLAVTT